VQIERMVEELVHFRTDGRRFLWHGHHRQQIRKLHQMLHSCRLYDCQRFMWLSRTIQNVHFCALEIAATQIPLRSPRADTYFALCIQAGVQHAL